MFTLTADSILLRVLATALVCCAGCQTGGDARTGPIGSTSLVASRALPSQRAAVVQIASYDQAADLPPSPAPPTGELRRIEPQGAVPAGESLDLCDETIELMEAVRDVLITQVRTKGYLNTAALDSAGPDPVAQP